MATTATKPATTVGSVENSQAVKDAQAAWAAASAKGDKAGMAAAHTAAENARAAAGYSGGSNGAVYSAVNPAAQNPAASAVNLGGMENSAGVKRAQEAWAYAYARGDKAGMSAAHQSAEQTRANGGYSGGANGATYSPTLSAVNAAQEKAAQDAARKIKPEGGYWSDGYGNYYKSEAAFLAAQYGSDEATVQKHIDDLNASGQNWDWGTIKGLVDYDNAWNSYYGDVSREVSDNPYAVKYSPQWKGTYSAGTDYAKLMQQAAEKGDYSAAAYFEKQRNAKITGEGLNEKTTSDYQQYLKRMAAPGYTYDPGKDYNPNYLRYLETQYGRNEPGWTDEALAANGAPGAAEAIKEFEAKGDQASANALRQQWNYSKDYATGQYINQSRGAGLEEFTQRQYDDMATPWTKRAGLSAFYAKETGTPLSADPYNPYEKNAAGSGGGTGLGGSGSGLAAGTGSGLSDLTGGAGGTDGTGAGGLSISGSGGAGGTGADYLSGMKDLLDQWLASAQQQAGGKIDYATQKSINDLQRAMDDAAGTYQTQRNQVAEDEQKALNNSALYAAVRGDNGGIGQSQYNYIQAQAAQNRQAVNDAQVKLSTDTARQITDLRAQGEYEKADKLLELSQNYLSQLMSLEQWQANYNLDYAQLQESINEWQKEYELKVADLTGTYNGSPTLDAQKYSDSKLSDIAGTLLSAGILPSDDQLAALGMTKAQAQQYLTAQQLAAAAKTSKSSSSGGGKGSGTSSSTSNTTSTTSTKGVKLPANVSGLSANAQNVYKTAVANGGNSIFRIESLANWIYKNLDASEKPSEAEYNKIISAIVENYSTYANNPPATPSTLTVDSMKGQTKAKATTTKATSVYRAPGLSLK